MPATRADAVGLSEQLRGALDKASHSDVGRRDAQDREWEATFVELVRQVYVHCAERGQLLEAVRVRMETQLKEARMRMLEQSREIAAMRKQAAILGIGGGGGGSGGGGSGSGVGGGNGGGDGSTPEGSKKGVGDRAHDARQEVLDQQRTDALASSAASLPLGKQAALMAKLAEGRTGEEAAVLLREVVGAMGQQGVNAMLSDQLGKLKVHDLLDVLAEVCKELALANRRECARSPPKPAPLGALRLWEHCTSCLA